MITKIFRKRKLIKLAVSFAALAILGTQHFNCAPTTFEAQNYEDLSSISNTSLSASKTSPITVLTGQQLYYSMLNVTGQSDSPTASIQAEYNARAGALPADASITGINAPLQTAVTSLAGEVCSGLIAKESATGATRKFFVGVNFTAGPPSDLVQNFSNAVSTMGRAFYGREISNSEIQFLNQFRSDFMTDVANSAAGTRALYLTACTAMLAAFDSMTY